MSDTPPPRNWLILEARNELWWRDNRCGYTKNLLEAGLYTEAEAKQIQSRPGDTRKDVAVPLSDYRAEVEQLAKGLARLQEALNA